MANKSSSFRPYARLLTMLGDQLIKNEVIALIEIIKNSYDADADWVIVDFQGFDDNYNYSKDSKIVVIDNGIGMSKKILETVWLNPATPNKKNIKKKNPKTKKGRIIQGEKGIGRFSLLKLGKKIKVLSRPKNSDFENELLFDFSKYDNEFLTENGIVKEIYLDELEINVKQQPPSYLVKREYAIASRTKKAPPWGTKIEVSNLKGKWNRNKIKKVSGDLLKLQSIFTTFDKLKKDFDVLILKDGEYLGLGEKEIEKLKTLLELNPVFKIEEGKFENNKFEFNINQKKKIINLNSPEITGLNVYKKQFVDEKTGLDELSIRNIECGSFNFSFYVFDFSIKNGENFYLDTKAKRIVKDHRIYLYRDGIRVYPYGDPEDDWLGIDIARGTMSASQYLSNEQVVGYVSISQEKNPSLSDKTNREGLVDEGNSTYDFISLIKIFLRFIRVKDYARYLQNKKRKEEKKALEADKIFKSLKEISNLFPENEKVSALVEKANKDYKKEKAYLNKRIEITEELAGVGMSVEIASHDIFSLMEKTYINLDNLIKDLLSADEINREILISELNSIRGGIGFIEGQLKDIQLLFSSTKKRRKNIRVKDVLEKVHHIFRNILEKEKIDFSIEVVGSPMVVKTTDAIFLQTFLNLFDNSIYWLKEVNPVQREIVVILNGDEDTLTFSDNGPGIHDDDKDFIFEPFYSGKGQDGRGLGLYIARQLLERNDFSIDLVKSKKEEYLSGANFLISFVKEG